MKGARVYWKPWRLPWQAPRRERASAARHRSDGAVQILNMFWHEIKSCSPLRGRDPPPFSVWSLIRPLGDRGRNTDTWIFSLRFLWHFLFFFWADLGIVSHCEISFHSKIEALISPTSEAPPRKATSDQWGFLRELPGFICLTILPSAVQSHVCRRSLSDYGGGEDLIASRLWQPLLGYF